MILTTTTTTFTTTTTTTTTTNTGVLIIILETTTTTTTTPTTTTYPLLLLLLLFDKTILQKQNSPVASPKARNTNIHLIHILKSPPAPPSRSQPRCHHFLVGADFQSHLKVNLSRNVITVGHSGQCDISAYCQQKSDITKPPFPPFFKANVRYCKNF